jgi:hypothetical protein
LAAYRLAWAELSGSDVTDVRAVFHYVAHDRTIRPADLLDADGLRRLLGTVPGPADDTDDESETAGGEGMSGEDLAGVVVGGLWDVEPPDDPVIEDFLEPPPVE